MKTKMKRRLRAALIVTAVLAATGVWMVSRWDAWFRNPAEAAYQPADTPDRVMLTFGEADGMSRNVSWTCGTEVRDAWVEIARLDEEQAHAQEPTTQQVKAHGEMFASRAGRAAYYVARLRAPLLCEGGLYRYRAVTGGKAGQWHEFEVPAHSEETAFIYVGDIQDTLGGVANTLLRRALERSPEARFLVCGGDLPERPTDAYWREAFRSLDSLAQSVPVLTVTGNHDYIKGLPARLERRFSLIHSYYLDSQVDGNQVFTVRVGEVQLFCLDSNRTPVGLITQRGWLREQLEASGAKWKVVVLHHPLHSVSGTWHNLTQRWAFDDLVRSHAVDLVLQGHEHAYARMTHHGDDGQPATPVYTISHCSPKSYRIEFDDKFDRFGSGHRYFQKVRTCGDTLTLTAYDAVDNTLYDSLRIVKTEGRTRLVDGAASLPELIDFVPAPGNKKDAAFARRIREYKSRRGIK